MENTNLNIGLHELLALDFDLSTCQLDASTTRCCAGGTRDGTRIVGRTQAHFAKIDGSYDENDALQIYFSKGPLK